MAQADEKATLLHCLLHWELVQPQAIWLTQPLGQGRTVDFTWGQAADQVRRMATHLRSLDLPPRSNIGLLGKNSAHWIMADLAIWAAGHVSVPLYPTLNAETAAYVLEHSEAKLLFVGKMEELWPIVEPGIPADLPRVALPLAPAGLGPSWDEIVARSPPLAEVVHRDPPELATIIYTSGSTGRPKGVMISFAAMRATAAGVDQLYPLTTSDRMLSYLPLAHAAERVFVETLSLYNGFRVYFAWSLPTFLEDLRRARPTLFFSVPRLWTKFYQGICDKLPPQKQRRLFRIPLVSRIVKRKILRQLGLQDVRVAVTGSAPLSPQLIGWYRELGLELLEGYAMSENFAYSHGNRPGQVRVGTVGTVAPGVDCRIDDNGEILVRSPGNMMGYYKDPEKTAADLSADGWFRTGDMGQIDAAGYLKITGRVKELFKTAKGKYVAPVPIENQLANHPAIEAVCVTGSGQPQPFALLLLSPEARAQADAGGRETLTTEFRSLLGDLNGRLEDHEQLDYLVVVAEPWTMDNGFLTPTMKIRRNVIEQRYLGQAETWASARNEVLWS
ncbi:AMP-binding acetyl-CoA synthetase [Solimonas sp. K1W22B-7]|uniref:AMP-binding protein n=1 Tax=Solimonas sp. K1W22B-7 TaxID=2303331 RepID=UPI000E335BB5|nr:AMP-binding protein [Solimonas sp. K1W22B-7]AXQ30138.1 AMP-binding acetyl-CoA synthetase [Solimonas sp. K1W22B-7]